MVSSVSAGIPKTVPMISTSSVPEGTSILRDLLVEVVSVSVKSAKSPSTITKKGSSTPLNIESKKVLSKTKSKVPESPVTSTLIINAA